jgi:hypothetical protein
VAKKLANAAHISRAWRNHEVAGDFRLENVWAIRKFTTVEAARVWVQVTQIDDEHWGAFGELVTMSDIVIYGFGGVSTDSVGTRIRLTMASILDPGAPA